jgi:hypothetical protein
MSCDAFVLFDQEAADWWAAQREAGDRGHSGEAMQHQVFCGSLKAWVRLEKVGATAGVRWLGGLGAGAWSATEERLADWKRELDALAPIPANSPLEDPIRELLSGDLISPALLSLALLPVWAEELKGFRRILLPVGERFRPARFSRLGDLPALVLAAVLSARDQAVDLVAALPRQAVPANAIPEVDSSPASAGAVCLAIGKLRHPEWPLLQFEAVGLPVVLFEPEPAPALPDLFDDSCRWRCHPQLPTALPAAPVPPPCPTEAVRAPASAWLESLRHWPLLAQDAEAVSQERQRLDQQLAHRLERSRPVLAMVPDENDLALERFVQLMRRNRRPCAVLHHSAEVQPCGLPLRWQRHLRPQDAHVMPLRGQRLANGDPADLSTGAVLSLDPVRAHLLEALDLQAPLPWPEEMAVGWIHYPLQQQALIPLADPQEYWQAVDGLQRQLAALGIPLLLARKPPLEPAGLADARAQGLEMDLPCLPFPTLLSRCRLLIAPGHLGTGHLEAMARGRAVALVSPQRLRRPSPLLNDPDLPLPRLTQASFLAWWTQQDGASLERLAAEQMEWLRRQLPCTLSLSGWLQQLGIALEARPQDFLGSNLMSQRPLLERAERIGRLARRLDRLRSSPPGRLLQALRRGGRP